jgi:hypothetical protein
MIPTPHLRLYSESVHKAPRLQQLWALNFRGDAGDVQLDSVADLIRFERGEWRDIPIEIRPQVPQVFAG